MPVLLGKPPCAFRTATGRPQPSVPLASTATARQLAMGAQMSAASSGDAKAHWPGRMLPGLQWGRGRGAQQWATDDAAAAAAGSRGMHGKKNAPRKVLSHNRLAHLQPVPRHRRRAGPKGEAGDGGDLPAARRHRHKQRAGLGGGPQAAVAEGQRRGAIQGGVAPLLRARQWEGLHVAWLHRSSAAQAAAGAAGTARAAATNPPAGCSAGTRRTPPVQRRPLDTECCRRQALRHPTGRGWVAPGPAPRRLALVRSAAHRRPAIQRLRRLSASRTPGPRPARAGRRLPAPPASLPHGLECGGCWGRGRGGGSHAESRGARRPRQLLRAQRGSALHGLPQLAAHRTSSHLTAIEIKQQEG